MRSAALRTAFWAARLGEDADVTGHGLDSALLSVTVTNVIRAGALAGADVRQPAQVLTKLNEAFQV